eukprot:gene27927-biopygen8503
MATHYNAEPLDSATTNVASAPEDGSPSLEHAASAPEEGSFQEEEEACATEEKASAPEEDHSSPDESVSIIEECSPKEEENAGAPEEGSFQEDEAGATEEKASVPQECSSREEEAGATEEDHSSPDESVSIIEECSPEEEENAGAPGEGSLQEDEAGATEEKASVPQENHSSPDESVSIIEECSPEEEENAGAPEEGSFQEEEEAGAPEENHSSPDASVSIIEECSPEEEENAGAPEEGSFQEEEEAGATEEKASVPEEGSPEQEARQEISQASDNVFDEVRMHETRWDDFVDIRVRILDHCLDNLIEMPESVESNHAIFQALVQRIISDIGYRDRKYAPVVEVPIQPHIPGILAKSGSSGSPTISFSNAPDTGLFNPVSGTLGVVAGGTEMVRVSDTIVSLMGDLVVSSNIVPMMNATQYIGTSSMHFKEAWIDELHISSNTLYIGDTPVLCADNDAVSIRADPGQGITLTTTKGVNVVSEGGVTMRVSGPLGRVNIQSSGAGSTVNLGAEKEIVMTAPLTTISSNMIVKGDLTVEGTQLTVNTQTVTVKDNIIVLNSGVTLSTGSGSNVLSDNATMSNLNIVGGIYQNGVPFKVGVGFDDGTVGFPSITFNSDSNTGLYRVGADTIGISTGGVSRVTILDNGNVGFGTNAPEARLHVVGDGYFNGNVIATSNIIGFSTMESDSNVKHHFEPITDALDKIDAIGAYTFEYRGDDSRKRHAGVIAQQVQRVLPEVVDVHPLKDTLTDVVELVEDLVVVIEYVFAVHENSKQVAHVHHEVLKAVLQKIEDELRTPSVELAEYVCHRDYAVDRVRIDRDLDVLQDYHVKKTKSRRAWILYVLEKKNQGMTRVKLTSSGEKEQFCSNVLNTKVSDKFVCKDLNSAAAFNEEIRTAELLFRNVSESGLAKVTTFSSIPFKRFNVVGIDLGGKAILSRDSGFYVFSLRCSMSAASKGISSDANMDKFVRETLENFDVIHRAGIIHGDVKLDNMIYCAKDDRYRLIDWGKTADHADMVARYVDNTRFGFVNNTSSPMAWFCSGMNYAASLVFMTMIVTRHME